MMCIDFDLAVPLLKTKGLMGFEKQVFVWGRLSTFPLNFEIRSPTNIINAKLWMFVTQSRLNWFTNINLILHEVNYRIVFIPGRRRSLTQSRVEASN
jgi:hypothetical protein